MSNTIARDLRAGVSVAGILLPEAIAYAAIAGLAPVHAIIAGVAGSLIYAIAGGSRFAVISPTSSSAAILAASLAAMQLTPQLREPVAYAAVLLVGAFFLAGGAARLGALASFVSRPVLRGFAFGIGITIAAKQLPAIMGVAGGGANPAAVIWHVLAQGPQWNLLSVALGAASLAIVLALRRFQTLPGAALVLAAGMAIGRWGHPAAWHLALVGEIAAPQLGIGWPMLSIGEWTQVGRFALPLVMIIFAESWASMRGLALRHGDQVEANRELRALGFANLAVGLVRGMPVGAGFSASSASEAAGAKTRWAGVVAAVTMLFMLLAGRGAIAVLPQPVLAAVVISALSHALNPAPLLRLWKLGRDEWVASLAALAVMGLGVLNGMLVAVALSLLALLRRLAGSRVAELGRWAGTHDFIDLERNPDAVTDTAILVLRPAEPLFFANAERVLSEVTSRAAAPRVRVVVLSIEESGDFDSTTLEAMIECDQRLTAMKRVLLLARAKDDIRDGLRRAGATALAGPDRSFWSVADAYDHAGATDRESAAGLAPNTSTPAPSPPPTTLPPPAGP